jgi:hypothetical protein
MKTATLPETTQRQDRTDFLHEFGWIQYPLADGSGDGATFRNAGLFIWLSARENHWCLFRGVTAISSGVLHDNSLYEEVWRIA